ncbi:MAG: YjbQ family protein, partial [Cyanobacteria bacterium J06648_11]
MKQHLDVLTVATAGKSLHKVTSQVADIVTVSGVQTGLCTLFLRHTSASLLIQEN